MHADGGVLWLDQEGRATLIFANGLSISLLEDLVEVGFQNLQLTRFGLHIQCIVSKSVKRDVLATDLIN